MGEGDLEQAGRVAIELSKRLVQSEAIPRRDVEVALLRHARDGVPFLRALLELRPQLAGIVESELARIAGPPIQDIPPNLDLMARLPQGLCSRLMGYPIGFTASSGVVDVLLADPLDGHAAQEFSYHLRTRVRILRGSASLVGRELQRCEGELEPHTARQDVGHMNDKPDASPRHRGESIKPIPLVRLKATHDSDAPGTKPGIAPGLPRVPSEVPRTRPGVAPAPGPLLGPLGTTPAYGMAAAVLGWVPAGREESGPESKTPAIPEPPPSSEEVRTSPGLAPPSGRGSHGPPQVIVDARRARATELSADREVSERLEPLALASADPAPTTSMTVFGDEHAFQAALSELAVADTPDHVVDALILGLGSVCREVLVMAPKGEQYKSRGRADGEGNPERFTSLETSGTAPSGLREAARVGQYLGEPLQGDATLFSQRAKEVCVTRVGVSGRVALLLCATGFVSSFDVTRRSDHLCKAAGDALARILLSRKRGA